jgi:hypothetical protein
LKNRRLYIGPTLVGYLGWPYNDYVSNGVKRRRREKRTIRKGFVILRQAYGFGQGDLKGVGRREKRNKYLLLHVNYGCLHYFSTNFVMFCWLKSKNM